MSFATNPQKGWVKVGKIDNTELLTRLADLQKRHDNLVEENNKIKESALFFNVNNFIQGDDLIPIEFYFGKSDSYKLDVSCNQIISVIGKDAVIQCEMHKIKELFGNYLLQLFKATENYK